MTLTIISSVVISGQTSVTCPHVSLLNISKDVVEIMEFEQRCTCGQVQDTCLPVLVPKYVQVQWSLMFTDYPLNWIHLIRNVCFLRGEENWETCLQDSTY